MVRAMLEAPILPTLARLAWPTVIVLVVSSLVGVIETYFLGHLGTAALAGAALVFPALMLLQMMSNGGIGSGVAAAVARALGAGQRDDAEALVFHALVLAVILGGIFSVVLIAFAVPLYAWMGGHDDALAAAVLYSNAVFTAAIPICITAAMAAVLRGSGVVKVPAAVTMVGTALLIPLSAALIFGWGPFPRLEIAGAGVAVLIYFLLSAAALTAYLHRDASPLRLRPARLEWRLFKAILGTGVLAAFNTIQSNLTVTLVTAGVGLLGMQAIAGYGVAVRLDYLLIPLLCGLGTAVLTMVAINMGAGQVARARKIAWTGAIAGVFITETIGLTAALFPQAWIGIFSDDPTILATGARYLQIVGPTYGLFGLGMMLYFASQGARRMFWPVLGGTLRLALAGFGAWAAARFLGASLEVVFAIVAVATALFGVLIALALKFTSWSAQGA